MPVFEIPRTDMYIVSVEAKDIEDAKRKCENDEGYLNCGSYAGSKFLYDQIL